MEAREYPMGYGVLSGVGRGVMLGDLTPKRSRELLGVLDLTRGSRASCGRWQGRALRQRSPIG